MRSVPYALSQTALVVVAAVGVFLVITAAGSCEDEHKGALVRFVSAALTYEALEWLLFLLPGALIGVAVWRGARRLSWRKAVAVSVAIVAAVAVFYGTNVGAVAAWAANCSR